jgi:site-specific DNA-methyltransferase (adenine-specific)
MPPRPYYGTARHSRGLRNYVAKMTVTMGQRRRHVPSRRWWKNQPPGEVSTYRSGEIVCADALDFLHALQNECADVVFLDPPFNLGKVYGLSGEKGDRLADDVYMEYMCRVVTESSRILKPGGSLYLYHVPRWALRLAPALEITLQFRHWIAIAMKNGFARGRGLYPAHYALLHYSKGAPAVANRPKIPPPTCPHCSEYIRDYGGYKEHVINGINLSDVWDDLSPVRHRKYKVRAANELPLAIPRRALEISGRRGGVLVDPFAGSGTSVIAARLRSMKFVANDREPDNCQVMIARLSAVTRTRRPSNSNAR